MNWVDRYHLAFGALAFGLGLVVSLLTRWAPQGVSRRALAVAGLVAAMVGGWGSPRAWPWWLAAAVLVVPADDARPDYQHPLGSWAGALAAVGAVGIWAAVPDTEAPLAVAAVLAPVVLTQALGRTLGHGTLGHATLGHATVGSTVGSPIGRVGTAALVVALVGSVLVGSAGWGSALASVCAVGAVAVAPLVLGFGRPLAGRAWWTLASAHVVVVLVVPRAVMRWSVPAAWVAAAVSLALLAAISATVSARWSDRRHSDLGSG